MPSLEPVYRSDFSFRSDISSAKREAHKSGILHAFKIAYAHGREEHTFAWLDDKTHENVEVVTAHLLQHGFDESTMRFVPFSSPYMECDENGMIKGAPYFEQCINYGPNLAAKAASSSSDNRPKDSRPTKRQKRNFSRNNTSKLVPSATLFDTERSQLHMEIYKYFSWLNSHLVELESTAGGRDHIRRVGITSVTGIQNLMTKLESTFRNVGEFKVSEDEERKEKDGGEEDADDDDNDEAGNSLNFDGNSDNARTKSNGNHRQGDAANNSDSEKENTGTSQSLPLLEEFLEVDLRRVVEEEERSKKSSEDTQELVVGLQNSSTNKNKRCDFDMMFERLVAFKERKGNFDVAFNYKEDGIHFGRWVYEIRRRKRELRAQALECEPPVENGKNADFINLPISVGRLGVTLQFYKSAVGAVVTAVDPACTFRDKINVGDRLVTIDGSVVSSVEDLAKGKDKNMRMFGIAKKKPYASRHYLSMERVERLESISFAWMGSPIRQTKTWEERFELLKEFKDTHGKWPKKSESWEGIGAFSHQQRRAYAKKDKNFMENRAPILEEIGFPWVLRNNSQDISWEDHVQRLVEFHRVNRHFNVPPPREDSGVNDKDKSELAEARKFYKWFSQLDIWYRAYKNGTTTRLNEDRIRQLVELGFEFKLGLEFKGGPRRKRGSLPVPDLPFEKRKKQLQKFKAELGHLNIDYRYDNWSNLGGWAAEISKHYKSWRDGNEAVSPDVESQFNELEALGFEFNVSCNALRRSWDESFDALLDFAKIHGHVRVPQKYKADVSLGVWVARQRSEYKLFCEGANTNLTQERCEKLESVGFIWDAEMDCKRERRNARLAVEDCSSERVNFAGMNHNDYCRMCYRKQDGTKLKSGERKNKCRSSRMGCAKCQEPICEECWNEGYDKHLDQK
ncbi:hypothetical protein ACHAXR_006617 [Thalassiosira sp. AJA248-18]